MCALCRRRARGRLLFPDIVDATQRLELIAEVDDTLPAEAITAETCLRTPAVAAYATGGTR